MSAKRGRKPSAVWQFFTLDDNKKHATCKACGIQRCKNVVTLENHVMNCEGLSDEAKQIWLGEPRAKKQRRGAKSSD